MFDFGHQLVLCEYFVSLADYGRWSRCFFFLIRRNVLLLRNASQLMVTIFSLVDEKYCSVVNVIYNVVNETSCSDAAQFIMKNAAL